MFKDEDEDDDEDSDNEIEGITYSNYNVIIHNSIAPSKELCSKMAPREVGVSFP